MASLDNLRTFKGASQTNSFFKFTVSGVTGTVASATLRLYVVKDGAKAGNLFPVGDNSWSEGTITWATAPAIGSTRIAQGGPAPAGHLGRDQPRQHDHGKRDVQPRTRGLVLPGGVVLEQRGREQPRARPYAGLASGLVGLARALVPR